MTLHEPVTSLQAVRDHLLGQFHHLQVIGVCPIEFKLGEFGVVLEGDAFVAEIAPDLVDPLEVADQQAFEIKLKGNAQVQILVQAGCGGS